MFYIGELTADAEPEMHFSWPWLQNVQMLFWLPQNVTESDLAYTLLVRLEAHVEFRNHRTNCFFPSLHSCKNFCCYEQDWKENNTITVGPSMLQWLTGLY
jgi:hypothetical protein